MKGRQSSLKLHTAFILVTWLSSILGAQAQVPDVVGLWEAMPSEDAYVVMEFRADQTVWLGCDRDEQANEHMGNGKYRIDTSSTPLKLDLYDLNGDGYAARQLVLGIAKFTNPDTMLYCAEKVEPGEENPESKRPTKFGPDTLDLKRVRLAAASTLPTSAPAPATPVPAAPSVAAPADPRAVYGADDKDRQVEALKGMVSTEDIGPYKFKYTKTERQLLTRWEEPRQGIRCLAKYVDRNMRKVLVNIYVFDSQDWLLHDFVSGALWPPPESVEAKIEDIKGNIVITAKLKYYNGVGAYWYDGRDRVVWVITEETERFPAEIVEAYLKKVPSALRKSDLDIDYDNWCRTEISRRISVLTTTDLDAFNSGRVEFVERHRFFISMERIYRLIEPTPGAATGSEQEEKEKRFAGGPFDIYSVVLMAKDTKEFRKDMKEFSAWWETQKKFYKAGSRRHDRRLGVEDGPWP